MWVSFQLPGRLGVKRDGVGGRDRCSDSHSNGRSDDASKAAAMSVATAASTAAVTATAMVAASRHIGHHTS